MGAGSFITLVQLHKSRRFAHTHTRRGNGGGGGGGREEGDRSCGLSVGDPTQRCKFITASCAPLLWCHIHTYPRPFLADLQHLPRAGVAPTHWVLGGKELPRGCKEAGADYCCSAPIKTLRYVNVAPPTQERWILFPLSFLLLLFVYSLGRVGKQTTARPVYYL